MRAQKNLKLRKQEFLEGSQAVFAKNIPSTDRINLAEEGN